MNCAPGIWRHFLPRLASILGLAAVCLGATSSSCSIGGSDDRNGEEPSFVTQLTLRNLDGEITDSFERGEPITMVLTVRNRLRTSASVDFTTTRTSDFVVVRENTDNVVWQWSAGQLPFPTRPTTLDFAAGETKTFTVTWTQVDNNDAQVRAGTYEARGVLVYTGFDSNPLRSNQMGSTLERFTID